MAAAEGDDQDVFGYHYENDMLAVNVFHLRGGKILDRREFFWEELPEIELLRVSQIEGGRRLRRGSQRHGADAAARADGSRIVFIPENFSLHCSSRFTSISNTFPGTFLRRWILKIATELEELLSEKRGTRWRFWFRSAGRSGH